jgi:hypothetical protein
MGNFPPVTIIGNNCQTSEFLQVRIYIFMIQPFLVARKYRFHEATLNPFSSSPAAAFF